MIAVFWCFYGWSDIVAVAGEVQRPERNLPLSLIFGTGLITLLYVAVNFVFLRVIPSAEMATVSQPAALAAERLFGSGSKVVISLAVTAAAVGCASTGLLLGPRVVYALAKDGLFPKAFARVHPRFRTPSFAIVIQAIWMSLLCLSGRYDQLYTYAIFAVILAYAGTGVALILFRRRLPNLPRPYRCWGYPVVPFALRRDVPRPGGQHHPRAAPGDPDGVGHPVARASGLLLAAAPARGGSGGAGEAELKHALVLTLLLASSPAPPPAAPLTGFSPERGSWQRDYEKRFLALPQPEECDAILRELTRTPHVAGTPGQRARRGFPGRRIQERPASKSRPRPTTCCSRTRRARRLEIVGETGVALGRGEEPIASDPDTAVPEAAIAWNAYAPSAEVTAEVVYVNRGDAEDYERLAKMGVDVRGKIALARYFGGYRGGKSLEAEKRGRPGLAPLLGPDRRRLVPGPRLSRRTVWAGIPLPAWRQRLRLPRSGRSADARPAVARGFEAPSPSESKILPKMPMMPLSARDAAEILKRLQGPAVPESSWQGLASPQTFRIGPGPARLHLTIENTRETRTIRNIIATLRGTDEPKKKILLSNHYDAWVYGATDPSSGTAAMLTLGRALGRLAAEGWKPRRTIVLAAWDAEEYALIGSTEWGEENRFELSEHAIVCINVDEAAHGPHFSPSASPLLFESIREAARDLPDPASPERSLADAWRESPGVIGVQSYATETGGRDALPVAVLGSGSDYTVFFNHLGVASTDLVFDGPYGVYHSVYDTYAWMATQGDPGFRYHAAMARTRAFWRCGSRTRTFCPSTPLPTAGRSPATSAASTSCRAPSPFAASSRLSPRRPKRGAWQRPPRRRRWPGAFVNPFPPPSSRARTPGFSRSSAPSATPRGFRTGPGSAT